MSKIKMDRFDKGIILFVIGVFLICLSSFFLFITSSDIIIISLTFISGGIIFMFGLWWMIDDKNEEFVEEGS